MSEESKYQIYVEPRGQYTIVKEKRTWVISFPADVTAEENIGAFAEMIRVITDALRAQKQKELERKDEDSKIESIDQ